MAMGVSLYGGLVLFSTGILVLYMTGAAHYLTSHEENTCEMTYMFEYAQYVRIKLDEDTADRYPRYGLYAYGEGFFTKKLRNMQFSGIPVLFVPGNAGSHEQVRSLASVSLRKSLKDRTPFHFDFFTINLNEEYSAFYGGVLNEQTEFVSHSIQRILQLYKDKIKSVILIGHSMGGIVAKGVVLLQNFDVTQVNTIITLATPHSPALLPDSLITGYYRRLQDSKEFFKKAGMSLIAVGGGPRDILVTADQAMDETADFSVLTTSIPDVWRSTDHLCILWCKQFVLALVRALFDSVDIRAKPPQISSDDEGQRLQAFSYHLRHVRHSTVIVQCTLDNSRPQKCIQLANRRNYRRFTIDVLRTAGKKLTPHQEEVFFKNDGEWIEDIRRQYVWVPGIASSDRKATTAIYLMIRLIDPSDRLTIQTTNLEARDWLFVCKASVIRGHSRICEWGWNLTNRSRISPGAPKRKIKTVDLNVKEFEGQGTHIVVRLLPFDLNKGVSVAVDFHTRAARDKTFGHDTTFFRRYLGSSLLGVIESSCGIIRHEVALASWVDSVTIKLKEIKCNDPLHHDHSTVEMLEPWNSGVAQVRYITNQDTRPQVMSLQTKDRTELANGREILPILRFSLDPECAYTLEVWHSGLIERLALSVRNRWSSLYGVLVALLLLALAGQVAPDGTGKITLILTLALSLAFGLGIEIWIAFATLNLLAAMTCCSLIFFGSVAHNVAIRFLARTITFSTTWSDWLLGGLNQLPLITASLLLSLIPATCGALAMLISVFLYFLKLTRMYEDYIEELFLASLRYIFPKKKRTPKVELTENEDENKVVNGEKEVLEDENKMVKDEEEMVKNGNIMLEDEKQIVNDDKEDGRSESLDDNCSGQQKILFHLILFMTWCVAAIPAVPSALVWAKNFRYGARLTTEDSLLMGSWVVLVGCATFGVACVPRTTGYYPRGLAAMLRLMGWTALLAAGIDHPYYHHYCMPPLIAMAVSLVAVNPLLPSSWF